MGLRGLWFLGWWNGIQGHERTIHETRIQQRIVVFFSHFNCENWLDYTVIWENIFETCCLRPKDDCASQSNGKNWVNDDNYVKERKHEILNK